MPAVSQSSLVGGALVCLLLGGGAGYAVAGQQPAQIQESPESQLLDEESLRDIVGLFPLTCEDAPVASVPFEDGAPPDTVLNIHEVGRTSDQDAYCLRAMLPPELEGKPTRLVLRAADDSRNYGKEQVTTSSDRGSEEISYYPFEVGVYGGCRTVEAELTTVDGGVYTATTRLGRRC
ncbi:hypothetical protein GCM10027425_10470 [Alteromonas gracilis]